MNWRAVQGLEYIKIQGEKSLLTQANFRCLSPPLEFLKTFEDGINLWLFININQILCIS